MSIVKSYYEDFAFGRNPSPFWYEEILKIAENNPYEKKALISLFKKEKDKDNQDLLCSILAELNEPCIIPYLLEIMKTDNDVTEKIWAAAKLIKVHYQESYSCIIEIVNNVNTDKKELAWEIFQINTFFSKTILKKLSEVDNSIKFFIKEFEMRQHKQG